MIDLRDNLCRIILYALAHLHDTLALALFLALDLYFVKDLLEFGLCHEFLISGLIYDLFTGLELD